MRSNWARDVVRLTVCAVQVGKTEDVSSAALGIVVCARADSDLAGGYISRGSGDEGAADKCGDDG